MCFGVCFGFRVAFWKEILDFCPAFRILFVIGHRAAVCSEQPAPHGRRLSEHDKPRDDGAGDEGRRG